MQTVPVRVCPLFVSVVAIAFRELVTDQSTDPNYEALLAAVKRVTGA